MRFGRRPCPSQCQNFVSRLSLTSFSLGLFSDYNGESLDDLHLNEVIDLYPQNSLPGTGRWACVMSNLKALSPSSLNTTRTFSLA